MRAAYLSVNKRRAIINIFVHSVYLYDDRFTVIINASNHPLSIDNIPLKDIEAAFSGDTYTFDECSSMKTPAPPLFIGIYKVLTAILTDNLTLLIF